MTSPLQPSFLSTFTVTMKSERDSNINMFEFLADEISL